MSELKVFQQRIAAAQADRRLVTAVKSATLSKVVAREVALGELHDATALRQSAAAIKQHLLDHLPEYLEQFVTQVRARGGVVHFAPDAAAACRIIGDLAATRGAKLAVKAKSMTSEEVHLNAALTERGVEVVETDLGEFIVQIAHDRPSHIVTPIIHKDRRQVATTMAQVLGCPYTEDPGELTKIARAHLRDIFRRCDLGITGVNFAVAETGSICLLTNEGNGRMTTTRPRVHIALVGIEKLVPRLADLPVFLKLIARSTTGQAMGIYTTLISGPRQAGERDGPEELHVVLLDNGRSDIWAGAFREVLRCIRCGACLNACPVFRNVGGHAYHSVYPGPIGSLVTPLLSHLREGTGLPRASSLCGACQVACPVMIDIPKYLVQLRAAAPGVQPLAKRLGLRGWRAVVSQPALYRAAQWMLRRVVRGRWRDWLARGPLAAWGQRRELPTPAPRTFTEIWDAQLGGQRGGRP
jgi:L-lactate dehydrogenase complex protein LldF